MRKRIALVLLFVMLVSLAGCGKSNRYTSSDMSQMDAEQMDFSSYVTPVSTVAPTIEPVATPAPTPVPTATPVPTMTIVTTPVPSTVILNNGYVTVTKSPTSETVDDGGKASFLAYANNFTSIQWLLANPDSSIVDDASNAGSYFPGIGITGQGASLLTFSNIPYDMNGWKVQAKFNGTGGPVYTNVAYIYVNAGSSAEKDYRDLASVLSSQIASATYRDYAFSSSDMTGYSYYTNLAVFSQSFTKGSWTVVAEFVVENENTFYPLAVTVYNGTEDVSSTYPLTSQSMAAFNAILSQLT